MQEGGIDYYSDSDINGCCLKCEDAEGGCLCYSCKCKKCYHYSAPEFEEDKGSCDIARPSKAVNNNFGSKGNDYSKVGLVSSQSQLSTFGSVGKTHG